MQCDGGVGLKFNFQEMLFEIRRIVYEIRKYGYVFRNGLKRLVTKFEI